MVARQVNACHGDKHPLRRLNSHCPAPVVRALEYEVTRDDSVFEDVALGIYVGDRAVESLDTLNQSASSVRQV